MSTIIEHLRNDNITTTDTVFPIFGGDLVDGKFLPKEIYGTAFYIKNDTFITCAHTIEAASKHDVMSIAKDEDGMFQFYRITQKEIYKENDSSIIKASVPGAKSFPWILEELSMLHNVHCLGYPYGFNREYNTISTRSYKGHIVLGDISYRFPSQPKCYELSYICPRGLSGAPLLFTYKGQSYVVGFIVGNEVTDMTIFSFKETIEEDNTRTIHEKTEALHRGIALQTSSFENIQSPILNMPFLDYLRTNGLLVEK